MTRDMTKGNPLHCILMFAVPVVFTNIMQQVYTLADTAIVARGVGVEALAALGSVNWLNWLMMGSVSGLTQGYAIIVAQLYGEKNEKELRRSVAGIIRSSLTAAVVLTLAMLLVLRPVLNLLHVNGELFRPAYAYSKIIFYGTSVTMLYNAEAGILRALGDSKTPLCAILVSTAINIALDVLFVFPLRFGVEGAAAATVIAQACAALLCLCVLIRQKFILPHGEDWKGDAGIARRILGLSFPIMLENIVISVGGLLVQSIVDLYGTNFIASFVTVNKLYDTLNIIATSLGYGVATFVGQNYGVMAIDRIRKGVRRTALISVVCAAGIGAVLYLFDQNIIAVFVSSANPEILNGSVFYLHRFADFLWVLYLSSVARYALQGIGKTRFILVSGIIGFLARSGFAFVLPEIFGRRALYFDEVLAWVLEAIVLIPSYLICMKKLDLNS